MENKENTFNMEFPRKNGVVPIGHLFPYTNGFNGDYLILKDLTNYQSSNRVYQNGYINNQLKRGIYQNPNGSYQIPNGYINENGRNTFMSGNIWKTKDPATSLMEGLGIDNFKDGFLIEQSTQVLSLPKIFPTFPHCSRPIIKTHQFGDVMGDFRTPPFPNHAKHIGEKYEGDVTKNTNDIRVNQPLKINAEKYGEYEEDTLFFIIHAAEEKNVAIAQCTNIWVLSPQTEKKVAYFFEHGKRVFLIFHVKNIKKFFGVAEFHSFNPMNKGKPRANLIFRYLNTVSDAQTEKLTKDGKPICFFDDGDILPHEEAKKLLMIFEKNAVN